MNEEEWTKKWKEKRDDEIKKLRDQGVNFVEYTDAEWKKRIEDLKAQGVEFAPENTSSEKIVNTQDTFWCKYGYLLEREGKHWIMYGGSGHGGPDIIQEITEEEYVGGRGGKIDLWSLFFKYPEKDGDSYRGAEIVKRWREKGILNL